jgi:hypothetical protein
MHGSEHPRPDLCSVLGHHDPGADGCCRDCGAPIDADTPVCRPEPMGGPIR